MNWDEFLNKERSKDYYMNMEMKLDELYLNKRIYPCKSDIFTAFDLCKLDTLKVVIIGQDPYHQVNQAHGLAFSIKEGNPLPKSLVNIFKELKSDLNIENSKGDLSNWAKQGVLLINTILTVEDSKPNSHKDIGWEIFFNNLINYIDGIDKTIVYILLGNNARSYKSKITNSKHYIIEAAHPSPLSAYRGFFNSKIFSKTNKILLDESLAEIEWKLK